MLQYTGASVVLAEDQEQVDKLYEIRSEIPHVRYVIYEDEKGMRGYKDPWLLSFAEVLERGREHRRKHPDAVERPPRRPARRRSATFPPPRAPRGVPRRPCSATAT